MATKNDESYFTLEKYEVYWEDACLIFIFNQEK